MVKRVGPWVIPLLGFVVATSISALMGPGKSALAMRAPRDMSTQEGCTVKCQGKVSPTEKLVKYAVTDAHFGVPSSEDPVQLPADVIPPLEAEFQANRNAIAADVLCGKELLRRIEIPFRPASVFVGVAGPSMNLYADAISEMVLGTTFFQSLDTFKGDEDKHQDLEVKHQGDLFNTLESEGGSKVIDYAEATALCMGDDVLLDEIPEDVAEVIKILRPIIKAAVDFVVETMTEGGAEAVEELFKEFFKRELKTKVFELFAGGFITDWLEDKLKAALVMKTKSHMETTVSTSCTALGRTTESSGELVAVHNEEGERINIERDPKPADPIVVHPVEVSCEGQNPLTVTISTNGFARAFSLGVRGEAVTTVLNVWGMTNMRCCLDQDGHVIQKDWSFVKDAGFFFLEPKQQKFLQDHHEGKRLFRFNTQSEIYSKTFNDMTETAESELQADKCDDAKKTLKTMHTALIQILKSFGD